MHLGGVAIEILGVLIGLAIVDGVTCLQGLGNRIVFVFGPAFLAKPSVRCIVVELRGEADVPG
jgi:hypothetical protein